MVETVDKSDKSINDQSESGIKRRHREQRMDLKEREDHQGNLKVAQSMEIKRPSSNSILLANMTF